MNIIPIKEAMNIGGKKSIERIISNGEKLSILSYEGDFQNILNLIENGPVDLGYKSMSNGWNIIEAAIAGGTQNGKVIIDLVEQIQAGKLQKLSDFTYSEKEDESIPIELANALKKYKTLNSRPALGVCLHPEKITDPLCSNYGGLVSGLPGEDFPKLGEITLPFLCQFNLTEASYVPPELSDLKLITVFTDFENPLEVVVRGYKSLEGLVCLNPDNEEPCLTSPAKISFPTPYNDYPCLDDIDLVEIEEFDLLDESGLIADIGTCNTKLGGYPYSMQSYPEWQTTESSNAQYVFQITNNSIIDLFLPEDGVLLIGRNPDDPENEWFFDLQFY